MDKKFDTAFIPQQPLLKVEGTSRFRERVNITLIVGFVCVFISVIVFGGVYFYKLNVDLRITTLEKELESKEESLQISEIDRFKDIDMRMSIAKKLLHGHVAFSEILDLIEHITAENIGWTALSYAPDERGMLNVSLVGQAPTYSAVYVQAQAWRGMSSALKSVDVSMPVLNPENGVVSFSAKLVVDSSYINYARTLNKNGALQAKSADKASAPIAEQTL